MSVQPIGHGDLVTVQVQPIAMPGVDLCALTVRQTLPWSASDAMPLVEVSYEPNAVSVLDQQGNDPCQFGENLDPLGPAGAPARVIGAAEIQLRFSRPVWFELQRGADPRLLSVVLLGANQGEVEVAPTQKVERGPGGEVLTPLVPEPADAPLDVPRTPPVQIPPPAGPLPPAEQRYMLQLFESSTPFDSVSVPGLAQFERQEVFATDTPQRGRPRHQLHLGFFADEASAQNALAEIRAQFPEAVVVPATDAAREAAANAIAARVAARESTPPPMVAARPADRDAQIIAEARDDIVAKEFSVAARKLEAVTQSTGSPYRKEAQELLGVAHERGLRYELAVADYKTFLAWYPDGPDAARVRQRLTGLMTADQSTREALRASRREQQAGVAPAPTRATQMAATAAPAAGPWRFDVLGGLGQTWRRENQHFTGTGLDPVTSILQSNLNLLALAENNLYNGRVRLDAGYAYDLLSGSRFRPRTQFANAFLEASSRDRTRLARVGRQSAARGGVLGRFDGGIVTYAILPQVRLNVVGGLPVEFSTNAWPNENKHFYGVNADIGQMWGAWDFNAFFIEQRNLGLLDRRAIGGEARYFKDNVSLFSLVDYDVSYAELNSLLALGSYFFPNRASVNLTVDYRKSPFVMTGDALQGQPVLTLDELRLLRSEDEIRRFAEDRAARSTSLTLGGFYPFNDTYSLNADFTASRVSATSESGGVPATPSTGWEYICSTQLMINNLPQASDFAIVGAQFAALGSSDNVSLFVGTRNAVTPQLRIAPTVRLGYSSKNDDTEDWLFGPSVRLDYRWKQWFQTQLELGANFSLLGQPGLDKTEFDQYYVLAGYRLDF